MSSRLASLLAQEGLVDPKKIAEAFQRQVIYGGTLDTALLELDAIEEPVLLETLGRSSGLPIAGDLPSAELLKSISAGSWFPSALSERFRALPIVVDGNVLRVLVTDPPDRTQLDELGYLLSRSIDPILVLEHRFMHAAALVYGTPVSARFASLQARLLRKESERGRRTSSSPPPADPFQAPPHPDLPLVMRGGPSAEGQPPLRARTSQAHALSAHEAKGKMEAAGSREQVFDALCRGARSLFDFAALWTVQAGLATARMAIGRHLARREELERAKIALDRPSPFRSMAHGCAPYVGIIGEEPVGAETLSALHRQSPITALLVPVVLRERTVAFVYGDSNGDPIDGQKLSQLTDLTAATSRAFQRLILHTKSSHSDPSGTDGPLESIDLLILSIVRGDEHAARSADALLSLGEMGAEALVARIPGPVRIDRRALREPTPKLSQHGPLLALLPRFGEYALTPLLQRVNDVAADVRFYAVLALGEIAGAKTVEALSPCLFDADDGVRRVAVEVLRSQPSETLRGLVATLRAALSSPDTDRQRLAADALGGLCDVSSHAARQS